MGDYVVLDEGERFVKPIDALVVVAADGMTQADFTSAEDNAAVHINAMIGWMYDITGWAASTPALIGLAADYIASATAMDMYLNRDTEITVGAEFMPDDLWAKGMELLEGIREGKYEVTDLSTGGLLQRKRISPRQGPRTASSQATFFPDTKNSRSFGKRPHFSAERTYEDV